MPTAQKTAIKLRNISITNYKGIDEIKLEFPAPRMPDATDIMVLGSRNGLGKTSILECCCLLLIAPTLRTDSFHIRDRHSMIDVPDLIVRSGHHGAEISGQIVLGEETADVTIRIDRNGVVKINGNSLSDKFLQSKRFDPEAEIDELIKAICGFTPNPVIESTFLLFHSYRKVQEGNPELGMMVNRARIHRNPPFRGRVEFPMSSFKLGLLRSLMSKADLFERVEVEDVDSTLSTLNDLVREYAGGTISKLRPAADNTVDFRIKPLDSDNSYTFDGLSSGQKEIISTLYLIWYHTRKNPMVVLIDEPELHLNAQWHRSFINCLVKLAPQNQYIMATHSEDIMDSVDEERRLLLVSKQAGSE